MADGVRSAPPELPGFGVLRSIGGGGFADVFLYRQQQPARDVAIKVLRAEQVTPASIHQFEHEANVMAEVSTHPYIVTVHSSGMAPDGRPYIVMEHYPNPHFAIRARGGSMPTAEVLRTSVQIASAVHHAHLSGIVHRDIKPANILTSEFNRPGLTDFGIAGVVADGVASANSGQTIEFAPPEALRSPGTPLGEMADVYSLAATVYALLSGRPPFWVVGGSNTEQDLLTRTLTQRVPPTGRSDTGPLEHLLAGALHPDPTVRPGSALAFARSLQDVEQQLHLPLTTIEARERTASTGPIDRSGSEGTRLSVRVVDPDGARPSRPDPPTSQAPAPEPNGRPPTPVDLPATDGMAARTVLGPKVTTADLTGYAPPAPAEPTPRRRPPRLASTPVLIAVPIAVVAAIALIALALSRGSDARGSDPATAASSSRPPLATGAGAPAPTDLSASWEAEAGRYTVEWTEIDVADGIEATYRIRPIDPTTGLPSTDPDIVERFEPGWSVKGSTVTIENLRLGGSPAPCVDIMTVLSDRTVSPVSTPVCP